MVKKILKFSLLFTVLLIVLILLSGYLLDNVNWLYDEKTNSDENLSDKIEIYAPEPNAVITSPFRIIGSARGNWYFEASFPITLLDENDKVITTVPATAISDWMTEEYVPFMAELIFDNHASKKGTIVFKRDNPSGLPENDAEVRIPIIFGIKETKKETIKLFYYNKKQDELISGGSNSSCSRDAVMPVWREIDATKTPVQTSIKLLLEGKLTDSEKNAGFSTEFPNKDFKLTGANIKDGVLSLEFSDNSNFTSGGSCRVGLLWAQIEKTAGQFAGIKEVKFIPETLFQP